MTDTASTQAASPGTTQSDGANPPNQSSLSDSEGAAQATSLDDTKDDRKERKASVGNVSSAGNENENAPDQNNSITKSATNEENQTDSSPTNTENSSNVPENEPRDTERKEETEGSPSDTRSPSENASQSNGSSSSRVEALGSISIGNEQQEAAPTQQINPEDSIGGNADPTSARHPSDNPDDFETQPPPEDPSSTGHGAQLTKENETSANKKKKTITVKPEEDIPKPEEPPSSGPGAAASEQNFSQSHPMEQALGLNFRDQQRQQIYKPDQIDLEDPPGEIDKDLLARIQGSIVGMALGDALGAHVEFRPHEYLKNNPVSELQGGGTWGLQIGQFTDDTSMALCLANSLIVCRDFLPYDQLVRYKWWYRHGYMSSTGHCFDIGNATRESVVTFEDHQKKLARKRGITSEEEIDRLRDPEIHRDEVIYCSEKGVAGNGALMRLGPVPLFFYQSPEKAVEYAGISGEITHGDPKARDACRYYAALIVAALQGYSKDQLLDKNFYSDHKDWFGKKKLESDVKAIACGSYQNDRGYEGGIRGKGYIVNALEAALWAFWSNDTFEEGAKAAVNLGDDTDTTAAIYGQLAGVVYQYEGLPQRWREKVYAPVFLEQLSKWIAYEGKEWYKRQEEKTESK